MSNLAIKGRSFLGYEIEIDNNVSVEEIKEFLEGHVIKNSEFFKNSMVTIKLMQERQIDFVIDFLKENGIFVNAIFVGKEKKAIQTIPQFESISQHSNSVIFKGNLRSGQTLESDDNLIILGNVNRDAYIYAKKNIFVMGKLEGIPHAGHKSTKDAFIFAFEFNSPQIRISESIAKAPEEIIKNTKKNAEVAFIDNDEIVVLDYKDWLTLKME